MVVDSWAADETKEALPVPLTLAALVFVGPRREVRPLQRPGCGALLRSRMWPAVKELGMPLNLCCGAVDCVAVQFSGTAIRMLRLVAPLAGFEPVSQTHDCFPKACFSVSSSKQLRVVVMADGCNNGAPR